MAHAGHWAALATAVLWTFSSLAWTSAGRHVGVLSVSFIRLLLTCVLLAIYGQAARSLALPTDASADTWMVLGLSGFLGFFLTDLCLFKSFMLVGPRVSLLILSLSPPIASLSSAWLMGDWLGAREWMAMGITLVGVAWVVREQPDGSRHVHYIQLQHYRAGIALALLAAVGHALALVLSKRGIGEYDPFAATFIRIVGSLFGYVPLVTLMGRWPATARAMVHPRAMPIITAGALVGPFLGVAMYMVAVRNAPAGVVATILATMPVLVLPLVICVYREKVTLRAVAGAVVSVAGVALLVM